jgi:serine/threonine-protein kinase
MTAELASDDPTTATLLRAVQGEFQLVREIGRGGMGVVFHAIDERLARAVAIKTLPPHLAADPAVRARFLREARTAGALSHPNIVPIYRSAERDGVVYIVMALVDGESLAERIARTGPLEADALVPIIRQIGEALDYAHGKGVVHRDVKAENVLLDREGRALLTDFGIARLTEAQPLTATGTVLGSVHYMSPEQVSGDALDGRSDLYALGVLMFFALTGRFPFERTAASAVLVAHVNAVPPRARDVVRTVPTQIDDAIARLLAKSPADRPASASALLNAVVLVPKPGPLIVPGTPSSAATPLLRLSSDDAQAVWARAAELQANTGAMTPPPTFAKPQELVTRGYDAGEVREAAREAGIDERYVSRALVERERQAVAAISVQPGAGLTTAPNAIMGAATKIEYLATVDREISVDAFEELVEEIRAATQQMVTVSAVGRTLTVSTTVAPGVTGGTPRFLEVTVVTRNGRTTVRAFEDLAGSAVGFFVGLGGGAGVGVGGAMAGMTAGLTHSPPLIIAALLTTVATAFGAARYLFGRSSRNKQAELEALVRRVVDKVLSLPDAR